MNDKQKLNATIACLENARVDEYDVIKMTTEVRDIIVDRLKELKQFKYGGENDAE